MGCDMDGNPFAYDSGSIFSWLWGKKKTAKKRDTPKKIAAICANPPRQHSRRKICKCG